MAEYFFFKGFLEYFESVCLEISVYYQHFIRMPLSFVLPFFGHSCFQIEPVDPSAPEPEGQSPATQQCREEEGQVGESAEQTGYTVINIIFLFFLLAV